MKILLFHINAFTAKAFTGNPAAVCPLEYWLDDNQMQSIAAENNLSETAFFVPKLDGFEIRWFTPTTEVDLCGHATLAAAFVLFNDLNYEQDIIRFYSRSGMLSVSQESGKIVLDLPARQLAPCDELAAVSQALGQVPDELYKADDLVAIFPKQGDIEQLTPDFAALNNLPGRGLAVTAPGRDVDFVSRWFGPKVGVNEDPVTGSAHCSLAPYWSKRLDKKHNLTAKQLSKRGGDLECSMLDGRLLIKGYAIKYMTGEIQLH